MNFPLVIGGIIAVYFLAKSSPKTSINSDSKLNKESEKSENSDENKPIYNIDTATINKKYLLDQRGFVFTGCEIEIINQDKMLKFAFDSGKKIKESEWIDKIFDGCDFLNRILDPESQFYVYEVYRYVLSGAVLKGMGNQIALSKLISFKKKLRNAGINVDNYKTTLIKAV